MKSFVSLCKNLAKKFLDRKYLDLRFTRLEQMICSINQYNRNMFQMANNCKDLLKYEYYKKLHQLLFVMDISEPPIEWIRVGGSNDGGYVMPFIVENERNSADENKKIAYSIGISKDVSWDMDMGLRGYDIFMYDHTINHLPKNNEKFHWKKIGVEGKKTNNRRLQTLEEMIVQNNHINEKSMILKMDIEGHEWDVLENIGVEILKKFDIIVMELHGLTLTEKEELCCTNTGQIIGALENINVTHQLVHIHANNMAQNFVDYCGNYIVPSSIEVVFASKEVFKFVENTRMFPMVLDRPCDKTLPDIFLGTWN